MIREAIRRVPGFRSGTRWKQVLAVGGYGTLALVGLAAVTPRTPAAAPAPRVAIVATSAPATSAPATAIPATAIPATAVPVAPTSAPAAPAPTVAAAATARQQSAASAPCFVGQIKANVGSGIFHLPTGASYEATTANVRCFDTAALATAAGFRQAER